MRIIYCDSVIDTRKIEPDYQIEKESAIKEGFRFSIISFEELIQGNIIKALQNIEESKKEEKGIYRGWMLTPDQYGELYDGLLKKNIRLINTAKEYKHCHYLPESYRKIAHKTPRSNWTIDLGEEKILELASEFNNEAIIVKDFVKSEKHNWDDACFIPNAADKNKVKLVVNNFIKLRGNLLNEGLVFRKYETLEFLEEHPKSKMPLTKEYRLFFANKNIIRCYDYWDEITYEKEKLDLNEFIEIAKTIESNFFTMDIARKKDGNWIIMELGDGQVAGVPSTATLHIFYKNLKKSILN